MASSPASYPRFRPLLVSAAYALILGLVLPGNAFGTFITSAGDAALSGALIQDFNSEPRDSHSRPNEVSTQLNLRGRAHNSR